MKSIVVSVNVSIFYNSTKFLFWDMSFVLNGGEAGNLQKQFIPGGHKKRLGIIHVTCITCNAEFLRVLRFKKYPSTVARDVPGGKRILIIKINAQHSALSKAIKTRFKIEIIYLL